MGRYYPPDTLGMRTVDPSTMIWVDDAGKVDVSSLADGVLTCVAGTYSTQARDAPFAYLPLFNALGQPHWDRYISMDFDLGYDGNPGDAGGGNVVLLVGVISRTDLTGPGYWAGVKWNSDRLGTAVAISTNGSATSTAGSGGVSSVANRIKGNISFASSGLAEINALMGSNSQNNARSFQSHNDQMYVCLALENAGSVARFEGISLRYRLNDA